MGRSRLLLGSTATSLAARDAVLNLLASAGFAVSAVLLGERSEEEDLLAGVADGQIRDVAVVVSTAEVSAPPSCDAACFPRGVLAALEAVDAKACYRLNAILIGTAPLPVELPARLGPRISLLDFPSSEAIVVSELAALLGLDANDELTCAEPSSGRRVRHNTPPATYLSYIQRETLFSLEGSLKMDNPVTALIGQGGFGKSSMARELAHRIVRRDNSLNFEVVVWVSDKAAPGSTTLGRLLDQLADTIDFPGMKSMASDEKAARGHQICHDQGCLIILDNLETVTDRDLVDWLADVPPPSRVLVTSREDEPRFKGIQRVVNLKGFSRERATEFVKQVMDKFGLNEHTVPPSCVDAIWAATAGNAKAMEVALGLLYSLGHPRAEVLGTLRGGEDQLFTDLFERCWEALDPHARSSLLAIGLLPFGATADLLSRVVGIDRPSMSQALESLRRLSLADQFIIPCDLDADETVLFSFNPLVLAFVKSKAAGMQAELSALKDRSVECLRSLAAEAGFCPGDIHRLDVLDQPQILRNIEATVAWCLEDRRYSDVMALTRDIRYYYYVRGIWSPDPNPNLLRAAAAREVGDIVEEFDALLYYCNIAAKQENVEAFAAQRERLEFLAREIPAGAPQLDQYVHVEALFRMAVGDYDEAIALWRGNLDSGRLNAEDASANRRWLGVTSLRKGATESARSLFAEAVVLDEEAGFERAVLASQLYLVRIDLREAQLDAAAAALQRLDPATRRLNDRLYRAEWHELSGRLCLLTGNTAEAARLMKEAAYQYDRLGLASWSREVLRELANQLEGGGSQHEGDVQLDES